jgi:hypothetical protein
MWNDTDLPLAYLVTSRCYGTWLHGDNRGSIARFQNRYKSPYIGPNERWQRHNSQVLEAEPVLWTHHNVGRLIVLCGKPVTYGNGICMP